LVLPSRTTAEDVRITRARAGRVVLEAEVILAIYRDHVYPRIVAALGNPKPVKELRRRMLPWAEGSVLEVGFGSGVNLTYYDPAKVRRLYALEPNEGMIRIAERHPQRRAFDVQFLHLPGERIPLADGSVDTVVSTFSLCTIAGVDDAICGIARVLKRNGRLIFIENTVSRDQSVRRWQKWWAPVHHRVFAGLDLTRDIRSAIEARDFRFDQIETGYLAVFPKSWMCCCWGIATLKPRLV
jgi:SAM-dependent methyltransferase